MLDLVLSALGELRSPFALYESDIHQMVEKQLQKARLPYVHEAKIGPGCRIDYLVGDVSSEHLRLKGFYKDGARTAIDKKEMAIVDYLTEYCNPGGPYFILELTHPVHYYPHQRTKIRRSRERRERDFGKNERYHARRRNYRKNENNPFKKRRVHQTKFKKKQSIAVKKEFGRHHSFIIKKRKGN